MAVVLLLALSWLMHAVRALGADPGSGALVALGYLVVASGLAGKVAERVRIPKLVGYLMFGVVAGPLGLGLVTEQEASALRLVADTAFGMIAIGIGCQANVARVRTIPPPLRAIVLCAVFLFGALAGMLISGFSRCAGRGAAAFAAVMCVAIALLAARIELLTPVVMVASGLWLASFAPASADTLGEQIAHVRLPLALVGCAVAGARLG